VTITGGNDCFSAVYSLNNTNLILNLTFDAAAIKMTVGTLPTQVSAGVYWFTLNATYSTTWKVLTK
jgi:hypothetical protein